MQKLSETELVLMEYIWKQNRPVTTAELIQNTEQGKVLKQNTVVTFLARMIKKEVLKAVRVGKANHYEACITEQEYRNFETKQFIKEVHRGSVFGLINSLFDSGELTLEDLDDIEKLVMKRKE